MKKYLSCIVLLLLETSLLAQINIEKLEEFNSFFDQPGKNLLLLGENHSSAVGSNIYPFLIENFNKNHNLTTLLIEFGPSEAYFYNQYLATGDSKFLDFTISAGYYKGWKNAWKKIYEFNKDLEKPLHVVGIDFDRTRTFAYCIYKLLDKQARNIPVIDSLLNVIKDKTFYTTYTVGYPTEKDKAFVVQTKLIINAHWETLENKLSKDDVTYLTQMLSNNVKGFKGSREEGLKKNLARCIKSSSEKNFFLFIDRDHAYLNAIYDDEPRLAKLIKNEPNFNTFSGVILHENSKQWGKDYKEAITLFELKNKKPWKEYFSILLKNIHSNLSIIPLKGQLESLSHYTDFLLVAKNQEAIEI